MQPALILHLSDLHLTMDPKEEKVLEDVKGTYFSYNELKQYTEVLKGTIQQLAQTLERDKKVLDAIVVSGDVTIKGTPDGFPILLDLIDSLRSSQPDDARVVFVPGNHDVVWGTPPGVPERYAHIVEYLGDRSFVSPLLEGVDGWSDSHPRYLLDLEKRFLIVPINTANYCGINEAIPDIANDDPAYETVQPILDRLRRHDMARVSKDQFTQLETMLRRVDDEITQAGHQPETFLRIAVFHHHLLPVSKDEELKKFESITNLGYLRFFLRNEGFRMVLHGHKHVEYTYWDHVYDFPEAEVGDDHRILVISGSTLRTTGDRRLEVARLLEISSATSATSVRVAAVPVIDAGERKEFSTFKWRRYSLWNRESIRPREGSRPTVVAATSVSEVYARLMDIYQAELGGNVDASISNLICQIDDASSAKRLPVGYPEIENKAGQELQEWFENMIKTWQGKEKLPPGNFAHGQRLDEGEQIDRAIAVLRSTPAMPLEGRAVVSLFDPKIDIISEGEFKFPAFCLIQLIRRRVPSAADPIDCLGFFRKQEMKYWWPINVGELADIQARVISGLSDVRPGTITTFTSIAHIDRVVPNVAIPRLDRDFYDEAKRAELWDMAYGLVWADMPDREEQARRWFALLPELTPPTEFSKEGTPVPVAGLEFLCEQVKNVARHRSDGLVESVRVELSYILGFNEDYRKRLAKLEHDSKTYAQYLDKVASSRTRLNVALTAIFATSADPKGLDVA